MINTSRLLVNSYYQKLQKKSIVEENQTKKLSIDNEPETLNNTEIYSFTMQDGQNFSLYKTDTYSADNPILIVKGTDKEGNTFEQTIDPRTVDPQNASFIEFSALSFWLSDSGEYDSFTINYMDSPTDDILEKSDYLCAARNWRDEQLDIGNMVGYNNAVKACSAISNYLIDQSGKTDYIETENGLRKAYLIDASINVSDLGDCIIVDGEDSKYLHAFYANDSTVENPIVEIQLLREDGSPDKIYRMYINDIDPENATQMEIFALCSHADKQGAPQESYFFLNSSYYAGFNNDFFDAKALDEFATTKHNWIAKLNEFNISDTYLEPSNEKWADKLLDILEKYKKEQTDTISGDGKLINQIVGEERYPVNNNQYAIQKDKEGTFTITNKENGYIYTFSEAAAALYKDIESDSMYLIEEAENGKVEQKLEISEALLDMINSYFMTNHIKPGELPEDIKKQIMNDENNEISPEALQKLFEDRE